jgi:hypothetical protein
MSITYQPDGLYLSTQATLAQLLEDETVAAFADGMLHAALSETCNLQPTTCNLSLVEALHYTNGPETYPLLTTLLALDAEAQALVGEDRRVLPLPGFLSYRASLPSERAPLETVRLPPLNPGGRYAFAIAEAGVWLAIRLDLHEILRVAGHVRLAISSPTRPPLRLHSIEDRLERQAIEAGLIETAIAVGNEGLLVPLTSMEQATLVEALKKIAV